MIGGKIGAYEVVAKLGEGGMGEVYRARDPKLNRGVALKVLPEAFTLDPDRLARFKREALVLASLNHPNIGAIYGFEESDGVQALVLELVEGQTLSERIDKGPLPLDEALAIAKQIADALEAAHEQGIIHRDLKPANVKVRDDGTVKVLDFGLAKGSAAATDATSPTVTSAPAVTEHGLVMGTPAYMSPEQATGQPVDHRTDIWAFGCVLFEMLSGRQPFKAITSVETLASVIKSDPDWNAVASAPAALQALIRRCLKKDARQRVHHIADVRMWLDESTAPSTAPAPAARQPRRRGLAPMLAVAGIAMVIGAAATFAVLRSRTAPPPGIVRFEITPPADQPFTGRPTGFNLAISPDARTIVYHAQIGETFQLVRRSLDDIVGAPIAGTVRAQNPTFSPDGQSLVFFADGAIRTLPLTGGRPLTVCELPGGLPFLAWLDTGDIVFTQGQQLMRVPANGGSPPALLLSTNADKGESMFFRLVPLPGGAVIVGVIAPPGGRWPSRVAVLVPGATGLRTLVDGTMDVQYAAGHLIYSKDNLLHAVPLDPDRLEIIGDARPLENFGTNQALFAKNGTYVYLRNDSTQRVHVRAVILRSDGGVERVVLPDTFAGRHLRISPDGTRLMLTTGNLNGGEIWIHDLRGSAQPIKPTSRKGLNYPVWEPEGRSVLFQTSGLGPAGVYSVVADGSVTEPKAFPIDVHAIPEDWSPDGSTLLYQTSTAKTGADLMAFDRATGQSHPWLQTAVNEAEARFSPEGALVAYVSDQTGHSEVFIRPAATSGSPIRVSSDGGHEPQWSRDGRQVFFQSGTRMMAATINRTPSLTSTAPNVLFDGGFEPYNTTWRRTYDVLPDGRFVALQNMQPPARQGLVVVMHAFDR